MNTHNELVQALRSAEDWISRRGHGENCYLSDHYDGDPGNQCNCGKDGVHMTIDAALADHARDVERDDLIPGGCVMCERCGNAFPINKLEISKLCPLCILADQSQPSVADGVALIAAERKRQIEAEGWTAEHDAEHSHSEMVMAACCYALPTDQHNRLQGVPPPAWPWHETWWKPIPDDRVRELVKAGALIAAEIDRLQCVAAQQHKQVKS